MENQEKIKTGFPWYKCVGSILMNLWNQIELEYLNFSLVLWVIILIIYK